MAASFFCGVILINSAAFHKEMQAYRILRPYAGDNREVDDFAIRLGVIGLPPGQKGLFARSLSCQCKKNEYVNDEKNVNQRNSAGGVACRPCGWPATVRSGY
ncbi:hypothetical protein F7P84_00455 [Edwardsiella anguillarum]|nr:hypothetical protein F7P84_00455 [Edwardsiella anguillarum]RFT04410.1 hypothetical protein CGL57_06345 [Edwardsiella anguillarum]